MPTPTKDCQALPPADQEGKAALGGSIGSQVFPSRSSHDNARSSPARTRSSISRCGSRNVCGTNTGDSGSGVPAKVKSRASGGTASMSDFLFILVDMIGSSTLPSRGFPYALAGLFLHTPGENFVTYEYQKRTGFIPNSQTTPFCR
jgi:hypothetical protein